MCRGNPARQKKGPPMSTFKTQAACDRFALKLYDEQGGDFEKTCRWIVQSIHGVTIGIARQILADALKNRGAL